MKLKKAQYFTPVVTAFDSAGNVDLPGNRRVWEHLIRGGVSGIVLLGSIGEFFAMTDDEKRGLIDEAAACAKGRTKLYVGTNCASVGETVSLSNYALERGADAVMVIGPYYFALSQADVESYYDEVASQVDGDIFLYNFPERTGYDLQPRTALNLLRRHPNIVGYKDTLGTMGHTRALIRTVCGEFPDFLVLSGFDEFFAHNVLSGGGGCIGGLSNIYPEVFAAWARAVDARDFERVAAIQQAVDRMMGLYDVATPFIPTIKKAMELRGVGIGGHCKRPFLPTDGAGEGRVRELLEEIDAAVAELGPLE